VSVRCFLIYAAIFLALASGANAARYQRTEDGKAAGLEQSAGSFFVHPCNPVSMVSGNRGFGFVRAMGAENFSPLLWRSKGDSARCVIHTRGGYGILSFSKLEAPHIYHVAKCARSKVTQSIDGFHEPSPARFRVRLRSSMLHEVKRAVLGNR
jgi:hypothetical protein